MTDTMIKLAGLYENESKKTGNKYFVGYMGLTKVLIFKARDPGPHDPTWELYIAERPVETRSTPNGGSGEGQNSA